MYYEDKRVLFMINPDENKQDETESGTMVFTVSLDTSKGSLETSSPTTTKKRKRDWKKVQEDPIPEPPLSSSTQADTDQTIQLTSTSASGSNPFTCTFKVSNPPPPPLNDEQAKEVMKKILEAMMKAQRMAAEAMGLGKEFTQGPDGSTSILSAKAVAELNKNGNLQKYHDLQKQYLNGILNPKTDLQAQGTGPQSPFNIKKPGDTPTPTPYR